jgi:Asp-tRNA(Asn)/Glu-tRNA(Gln) amidotransferase A subunit family amidase
MIKVRDFRISDLLYYSKSHRNSSMKLLSELRQSILLLDGQVHAFSEVLNSATLENGVKGKIPFSVKDIIDTAGIRTSYGSKIYSNNIPNKDATILKNVKRSGGILQGKTNTHEFAMGIVTPQCRNPWNVNRITGGSSGGSAAAVAACFSPFSIGTDTAGSIRIPASFCGVTGIKPTNGLLSLKGIFPEAPSLDTVGPLARYASDIPLILMWMGAKFPSPSEKIDFPIRVGIINELFGQAANYVYNLSMSFLNKMEKEDIITISEVSIPEIEEVAIKDDVVDSAENFYIHMGSFSTQRNSYSQASTLQLQKSSEIRAYEYIGAKNLRKEWKRKINELFRNYAVLISPTAPDIAPKYSSILNRDPGYFLRFMKFTNPFNFSGTPSITIPSGFHEQMPIGLQLSGPRMSDIFISKVAEEFQKISDFHLFAPENYGKRYNEIIDNLFYK